MRKQMIISRSFGASGRCAMRLAGPSHFIPFISLCDTAELRWNPAKRSKSLIDGLPSNPGLRQLSNNPLLLSLIVGVHHNQRTRGQELPRERYDLYARALELQVQNWERMKDDEVNIEPTSDANDLNFDHKLRMLRELAWAMFEQLALNPGRNGQASNTAHIVIHNLPAQAIFTRVLEEIPTLAAQASKAERNRICASEAERWLRELNDRGGVLQELGNLPGTNERQIQFAHLTFQEYLAARAIASEQRSQRQRAGAFA
jgi:predicted NACHT family NTPase